jgi:peroxiredoxin
MQLLRTKTLAALFLAGVLMGLVPVQAGTDVGQPAETFSLQVVDGKQVVNLADFKGKPTLVVFWALWCPPCRREIPLLKDLQSRFGSKGLTILSVAIDYRESREAVASFQKENDLTYKVLWDQDSVVSGKYGVTGIPTAILVGPDGIIRFRGHQLDESFMTLLQQMTEKPAAKP